MNILKLNRFFYLFITLVVVGVLVTSCERESIVEDIDQLENLQLKISESEEFIELVKLQEENNFKTDNESVNFKIGTIKQFSDLQMESITHYVTLLNKNFPLLKSLSADDLSQVYIKAMSAYFTTKTVGNQVNKIVSCESDCYSFYLWLNQQDYAAALSQIRFCKIRGGSHSSCVSQAMSWYSQASAGNYNNYLQCYNGC